MYKCLNCGNEMLLACDKCGTVAGMTNCLHYKECMAEGYKAMADERRMMNREELERRINEVAEKTSLEYEALESFRREILAEFDRLTEGNETVEALGKKGLTIVHQDWADDMNRRAEALERICEPLQGDELSYIRAIIKTMLRELTTGGEPYNVCRVNDVATSVLAICDYLDSQQKPCSDTVINDGSQWSCNVAGCTEDHCPKPKDEEVLREILIDSGCFTGKPIEMEGLNWEIRQQFQLKEEE